MLQTVFRTFKPPPPHKLHTDGKSRKCRIMVSPIIPFAAANMDLWLVTRICVLSTGHKLGVTCGVRWRLRSPQKQNTLIP